MRGSTPRRCPHPLEAGFACATARHLPTARDYFREPLSLCTCTLPPSSRSSTVLLPVQKLLYIKSVPRQREKPILSGPPAQVPLLPGSPASVTFISSDRPP